MIINSNANSDNKKRYEDLSSEVDRVKVETETAELYHRNLQDKLKEKREASQKIQFDLEQIKTSIAQQQ